MNYIIDMDKMPVTRKGLKLLIAGLLVMVAGYILMMGPKPVPELFNESMFDFRRLVAAPVVILAGIVLEIVAIMGVFKDREEK